MENCFLLTAIYLEAHKTEFTYLMCLAESLVVKCIPIVLVNDRRDITPSEIDNAKIVCNQEVAQLFNLLDKNMATQPLLCADTQKSITPEVMELALVYLDQDNIRRLISHMSFSQVQLFTSYLSVSQTHYWLAFTEQAR